MYGISDWIQYYENLPPLGIQNSRQVEGVCKKATGGRFLFAKVLLEFSPSGTLLFEESLSSPIKEMCIHEGWFKAICLGVLDVMLVHSGTPITQFKCNLLNIEFHEIDSSRNAFRLAGRFAAEEFLRNEKFVG